jgi:cysteine-rich repeat protein
MIVALLYGPSPALAQATLDDFAALAGRAVTCTGSTVNGDVGVASPTGAVTCMPNTGTVYSPGDPVAQAAYADFLSEYATLATQPACTGTLPAVLPAATTLMPGVYCADAAVTGTGGTLTLDGPCDGTWIFKIGTLGTGALTTTNFTVQHANPLCDACDSNVIWWISEAATLTDSTFIGSIYAGADITVTRGALDGQAVAGGRGTTTAPTGAVTLTGPGTVNACGTSSGPVCGNGVTEPPEECDDGNITSGDGCSAQCKKEGAGPVCGNGVTEPPEECDDGNITSGDGCSAQCKIEEDEPVSCSEFPCGNRAQNVQVCHIPPGNPQNANTICISPNAVDTHIQQHGDYCGPCKR